MSSNNLGYEAAAVLATGNLSRLCSLSLFDNHVGDEGAQALATGSLDHLVELNLGKNNISVSGVKAIVVCRFSGLTLLDLSKNKLGYEAAEVLATADCSNLEYLRLFSTNIGDAGVKALAINNFGRLRELRLGHNNLGDEAAAALAAGEFSALTLLSLKRNNIADSGAIALASGSFPSLTLIDLAQNQVGLKGTSILTTGKRSSQTKVILKRNQISIGSSSYTAKELANCMYACVDNKLSSEFSSRYVNSWLGLACEKIQDFEVQDLSGSIHGLVAFKDELDPRHLDPFLKSFFQEAEAKLSTFTPHHLSSMMLDFGKLLASCEKIPLSFLRSWFQLVDAKWKDFEPKCLVNSLIGLALLRIPDFYQNMFVNQWQHRVEMLFPAFNEYHFSGILNAFSKRNVQPCKHFLEQWEQEALKKLKDFGPKQLSISLYAFASLGLEPSKEFLAEWERVAFSKLNDFDFQSFCSAIYAYALLDKELKEEFINKIKSQDFVSSNLEQVDLRVARELYLALIYYDIEVPAVFKHLVNNFKVSVCNKPSISSFQKDVCKQLNRLFPKVLLETEFWIDGICNSVDIAIPYKNLIIEVDGPYHFIQTSEGEVVRSPHDKLKDKILKKLGWTVKHISYSKWPAADKEKINFLKYKLRYIQF